MEHNLLHEIILYRAYTAYMKRRNKCVILMYSMSFHKENKFVYTTHYM